MTEGRLKRFGSALGRGLDTLGTALNDGPKLKRIEEIDITIKNLKQERDHLIAGLYEPGDLKVSKHYDPMWRPPVLPVAAMGGVEARLTDCAGREYMGRYHKAHPACPYIDTVHNAHQFTLKD